jgi:fructose-1,6-bisphosphatase I
MQEIIEAIQRSAIVIDRIIKEGDSSKSENQNSSGDTQLKLDVKSDVVIEEEFMKLSSIKSIISEEKEEEVHINPEGKYLVGYDPLDGSSLVDVNLSVGSIFGIYENDYKGNSQVASVYVVYGPRVEMVVATDKLEYFRLYKDHFEPIELSPLEKRGMINASGGTQKEWFDHHRTLISTLFDEGHALQYSGGMVPDLHNILLKGGGLFSYPGTKDKPQGKLRMIFEVFPFAHVFELAGGAAINSKGERLLDLEPSHLHDTADCFFGSEYEISKVKEAYGV